MSDQAEAVIGNDQERGYASSRLNSICVRYGAICKRDCPEMTVAEWMACCDVLNSTVRDAMSEQMDIAKSLWMEIRDSEQDGLGEKWGIDCNEFAAKLDGMPYSSQCAIIEVVSRFWLDCETEYPSDKERLQAVGAKITP